MASTTNENYITETILVPLYNRSAGFRKMISKKFGTKVDFGSFIRFTGNNGKNSKENNYGFPDATSDLGNIIEVKINYDSLTDYEKKGGMDGNGYERFLKDNPTNYLLYIVPDYYEDSFVISERAKVLTWSTIVDYITDQNDQDPLISIISNKVEGLEEKEMRTFNSYKAKAYESLIKAMVINPKFLFLLNETSGLNEFPDKMENSVLNKISFRYNNEEKKQYWLNFSNKGIFLELPPELNSFCTTDKVFSFIDDSLKVEVISKNNFWKYSTDEIADKIVKKLTVFINSYERIEKDIENYSKIYIDIFFPALTQFAKDKGLEFDKDKDSNTFYFQKEGASWWYAFQFEENYWRNFVYGIFYQGSKKNRTNYEKVLEDSNDDGCEWPSYKYFDIPYKNWGIIVFEELEKNPKNFITKHILSKIKEIDKALK